MLKTKCLALLLLLVLVLSGCAATSAPVSSQLFLDNLPTVEQGQTFTTMVEYGTFSKEISAGATAFCPHITLVKTEYDNAILLEKTKIGSGDEVTAGQVIATFGFEEKQSDYDDLLLRYNQSQNAFTAKRTSYESTLAQMKDEVALSQGDAKQIAALNMESKQLEYEQFVREQQVSLGKLKEQLDELYFRLTQTFSVVIPNDGVVYSTEKLEVGKTYPRGTVLATIYETDYVLFRAEGDSVAEMTYHMKVTLRNPASEFYAEGIVIGSPYGIVDFAADEAPDDKSVYILVEDEEAMTLLYQYVMSNPTSYASMRFGVNATLFTMENILYLDADAVNKTKSGDCYVYTVKEDGSTQKQYIICGPENNKYVSVFSGLAKGQLVVLD